MTVAPSAERFARSRRLLPTIAALLVGCRTPSPTPSVLTEASSSPPPSAVATPSAPPSAAASALAPRASAGCWGSDLPASATERLTVLGQRCAAGLKPSLQPPRRADLATGVAELSLPALPPGACLRVGVVASSRIEAQLTDAQGLEASDAGPGFALLDPGGPICPRAGEALTLRVKGTAGGEAWVQVWASTPR